MKKKTSLRMLFISSIVASVVVSVLVSGVVVKANGSTLFGDAIRFLELVRDLGDTPTTDEKVGAIFTTDDIQTSNFNNLSFATNSNHPEYINGIFEYMDTLSNAATTTPLSIKNTWNQDMIAEWAIVMPVGAPSTTLYFSAGTSTVSSVAYGTEGAAPECAINNASIVTSTQKLITSLDPTGAAPVTGSCIVRPNEYFVIYAYTDDTNIPSTTTVGTGVDIKYSARLRIISTSTVAY